MVQNFMTHHTFLYSQLELLNLSKSMRIQYKNLNGVGPQYKPHKLTSAHYIEVGMFSTILAGMCIENNRKFILTFISA